MRLLCCRFAEMKERIEKESRRIVLFGAGAIGQVTTPEILNSCGLMHYVDCYIDNNPSMHGTKLSVRDMIFEVRSSDYLNMCPKETAIILNISRFSDVLEQIENMQCTKKMDCYIMPMMLINNFCSSMSLDSVPKANKPLIPKKLHYTWFGEKPISVNLKKCMESWRRFCPDYEIIEWNETNYDIERHTYMKQAYEAGAYAFVSDYARLDILYNEGGFYLDTDVELKRNIDELLYQDAFCGVEKWQLINSGGLCGAVPRHAMIKKLLDARGDIEFINVDGKQNRNTCGFYDTKVAIGEGYKINGRIQIINGMVIYPYDYFHPYDYMSGIVNETDNTYSVHWFNGGWMDKKMKMMNEASRERYMKIYQESIGGGNGKNFA